MKQEGLESDLMQRIATDPAFPLDHDQLTHLLAPEKYTGRAAEQCERFVNGVIRPIIDSAEDIAVGDIRI